MREEYRDIYVDRAPSAQEPSRRQQPAPQRRRPASQRRPSPSGARRPQPSQTARRSAAPVHAEMQPEPRSRAGAPPRPAHARRRKKRKLTRRWGCMGILMLIPILLVSIVLAVTHRGAEVPEEPALPAAGQTKEENVQEGPP